MCLDLINHLASMHSMAMYNFLVILVICLLTKDIDKSYYNAHVTFPNKL